MHTYRTFGRFYTDAVCPAVLHTCRESREEAQKVYKTLEVNEDNANSKTHALLDRKLATAPLHIRFGTHINFEKDVLYLNQSHLKGSVYRPKLTYMGAMFPTQLLLFASWNVSINQSNSVSRWQPSRSITTLSNPTKSVLSTNKSLRNY